MHYILMCNCILSVKRKQIKYTWMGLSHHVLIHLLSRYVGNIALCNCLISPTFHVCRIRVKVFSSWKIPSREFNEFTDFELPWMRKWYLDFRLYIHMYVCMHACMGRWMCASLAPERLDGVCSCSVFKSLSVTGWLPVNMKILAQKIWVLKK
jgi:hypothetical protein